MGVKLRASFPGEQGLAGRWGPPTQAPAVPPRSLVPKKNVGQVLVQLEIQGIDLFYAAGSAQVGHMK